MDLSDLRRNPKARRARKRVGRGIAAGQGKTAGRGEKGQTHRYSVPPGFEGGQMPLQRRLPKFGFYHYKEVQYQVVNLGDLNKIEGDGDVTPDVLKSAGLVKHADRPVKLLGDGTLEKKLNVKVHAASKSAQEQVEKLGGTVTLL